MCPTGSCTGKRITLQPSFIASSTDLYGQSAASNGPSETTPFWTIRIPITRSVTEDVLLCKYRRLWLWPFSAPIASPSSRNRDSVNCPRLSCSMHSSRCCLILADNFHHLNISIALTWNLPLTRRLDHWIHHTARLTGACRVLVFQEGRKGPHNHRLIVVSIIATTGVAVNEKWRAKRHRMTPSDVADNSAAQLQVRWKPTRLQGQVAPTSSSLSRPVRPFHTQGRCSLCRFR